ncbi:MAG: acetate--CoA ligase family protein [Bacteroidales bacterium]|jgi:acyl-CoA synthetase (NDP forming)|nr:acetate--CoA ligase family protein [Bacteroidales bacterium]MDI9575434.1 acetate--CoA ligase family protein [Bacteroidota bacterium]MDY0401467.1 acetate--CoA ligase family protein [Bacteroidales bacterium]HHW58742.1 CoA-binding protein [Bacteroidales bacterium]HOB77992.1 acetate--CoA ligase family protein [Bacteroidales bacterium]
MIRPELINPKSIVIVGASNNVQKPGGKILKNILDHKYKGQIYIVNPNSSEVQGFKSYQKVDDLPDQIDLAILAIPAHLCPDTVEILALQKGIKAFIIISAGFSEESNEGAKLEKRIVDTINSVGGSLIGPNCTGVFNTNYAGIFTTPLPEINPQGCDFITASGATGVFIVDLSMTRGLPFSSIYSVGNSAQLGVEDILEYMDETFDPDKSSKVKLLYMENVKKPQKLLKHAQSLISKGCRIAAIKAGYSEAGSRAAASHTGAMITPDIGVDALFKKAGIVRCYGRDELVTVASIFMHKELIGNQLAIITHAGGPAVMLTDALSHSEIEIPPIKGEKAQELLSYLFPGSSVNNPIDFLATGTAEQLGIIIDYCEKEFDNIDGMVVIFGSPGLFPIFDVYNVLHEKMLTCKKPIYPILPCSINVADEVNDFISKGHVRFPDEVLFAKGLISVYNTPKPQLHIKLPEIDKNTIRHIIDMSDNGFLAPHLVSQLLDAAGIPRAKEKVVTNENEIDIALKEIQYPLVMKVVGPIHKTDVGGVVLNVKNKEQLLKEFHRLMHIKDATGVLLQPMLTGTELFIGGKKEGEFGHIVTAGLGGIFVEVLKDIQIALSPVSLEEALNMIKNLKGYKIIKGVRGSEGVDEQIFANIIQRVSALLITAPEISEMDINPLLGTGSNIVAVDARINIQKN